MLSSQVDFWRGLNTIVNDLLAVRQLKVIKTKPEKIEHRFSFFVVLNSFFVNFEKAKNRAINK